MALWSAQVEWEAGGYPPPTYSGVEEVSGNFAGEEDPVEVMEQLAIRGRRHQATALGFTTASVRIISITDLRRDGERMS